MSIETFIVKSSVSETRGVEVAPSNLTGRVRVEIFDTWVLRPRREATAISAASAREMANALIAAADEAERREAEAIKQEGQEVGL